MLTIIVHIGLVAYAINWGLRAKYKMKSTLGIPCKGLLISYESVLQLQWIAGNANLPGFAGNRIN